MGLVIAKRQRIAIGCRLSDSLGPNHRSTAWPVIYHKGAAWNGFLQGSGKGASQHIG
jgi:hypothetical protein